MRLPARPEAVPTVRREVELHALRLGISDRGLADLKTVVSEACTNVVRYAYVGEEEAGPLEVEFSHAADSVKVVVRDHGCGIAPKLDADPSLHMGLPLIGALSSRFVLASERGAGTELEIHVPLAGQPEPAWVVDA